MNLSAENLVHLNYSFLQLSNYCSTMDHLCCRLCVNLTINIQNSCQHLQSPKVDDGCVIGVESVHSEQEPEGSDREPSQYIYDDSDDSESDGQYESSFVTTDGEEEWDDGDLSYVDEDELEDDEDEISSCTSIGSDNDDAEDS
jgi:hypothetical protein